MDYTAPTVDVIGAASQLVQDFAGPYYDGDGFALSEGGLCSSLEEE